MKGTFIYQNLSTTGTLQSVSLGSAVSAKYITISDHFEDQSLIDYCIEDGNNWETGLGKYTSSGNTISRDFITAKKEGGTYSKHPLGRLNLTSEAQLKVVVSHKVSDFQYPGINASQNIMSCAIGSSSGNTAIDLIAGREYYIPVFFASNRKLLGVSCYVNIAAAGDIRMAVYRIGTTGLPESLVVDAGTVSANSTGIKTIDFSSPVEAGTGWFCLFIQSDVTPRVRSQSSLYVANSPIGMASLIKITHLFKNTTFAPAPSPASLGLSSSTGTSPILGLKT